MTDLAVVQRHYRHAPHAGAFMTRAIARSLARAVAPGPGRGRRTAAPQLQLHWHAAQWSALERRRVIEATDLHEGPVLDLLLPQVLGFRLVMATLTDAAFALPIWRALQVRNRLRSLAPLDAARPLELGACTGGWRALPKGCEIDVHLSAEQDGRLCWQGVTTFYYRGARMADAVPGDVPAAPDPAGPALARWCGASAGGWRFGRLTGDFNGVHWSDRYARAMGFGRAFHHPARALGQCLAQWQHGQGELRAPGQALDVWIKGPVPYGCTMALHASGHPQRDGGAELALRHDADARAALAARWWVDRTPGRASPP